MVMRIYADLIATTRPLPEVVSAVAETMAEVWAHPAGLNSDGFRARECLESAREAAAEFMGAGSPDEIIFTSGGTESANHAITGLALAGADRGRHLVIGAVEHPAVLESARRLESRGFEISWIPCDGDGRVSLEDVQQRVRDETVLVALQRANLDSGAIHPVAEVAVWLKGKGIPIYCDGQAAAGWLPLSRVELGVDVLSVSAHRFFGPKGVGVVACRPGLRLEPLIVGGRQESERRAGTENLPGIVGAAVAMRWVSERMASGRERLRHLQEKAVAGVMGRISGARLLGPGPGNDRLPHHLAFSFEGVDAEEAAMVLDLRGVSVTVASGCLSPEEKQSHVFRAMGISEEASRSALILGFGPEMDEGGLDDLIRRLEESIAKVRSLSPNRTGGVA
jgi:cysteine desulfurase